MNGLYKCVLYKVLMLDFCLKLLVSLRVVSGKCKMVEEFVNIKMVVFFFLKDNLRCYFFKIEGFFGGKIFLIIKIIIRF